jgi:hypothetical protein
MSVQNPVSALPLSEEANYLEYINNIELMDEQTLKAKLQLLKIANSRTNHIDPDYQFNKLCLMKRAPIPIPPGLVPIYATDAEVEEYENTFSAPLTTLVEKTLSDLLSPFQTSTERTKKETKAKLVFLSKFLKAIKSAKIASIYSFDSL